MEWILMATMPTKIRELMNLAMNTVHTLRACSGKHVARKRSITMAASNHDDADSKTFLLKSQSLQRQSCIVAG